METSYDLVAYPAQVFPATHPDHLAAIARLHGLAAPPVATARVLEIAGGDGLNMAALAALYPEGRFHSFDLSAAAVRRGVALGTAAGLDNLLIEQRDLLDAAEDLTGEYDYVVAHGVYAWVPEAVRAALLRLAGRVLAPGGVAFISYNAMPGGYMRRIVRDMLFHHLQDVDDPALRLREARRFLAELGEPVEDEPILQRALRHVARPMAAKHPATLWHDELGDCFEPQALKDVVAAALPHGLAFLNDSGPLLIAHGLPGEAMDDAAVVRRAQARDYESMAFFHQTLFIRPGRAPARTPDMAAIPDLWMNCNSKRLGPLEFEAGGETYSVGDEQLADVLEAVSLVHPRRARVGSLIDPGDAERLDALFRLYAVGIAGLWAGPLPGVVAAGERPCANPLVRAQLAADELALLTLDHRPVAFEAPGPRRFLALCDGTRDRAALAVDWSATEFAGEIGVDTALEQLGKAGMLIR